MKYYDGGEEEMEKCNEILFEIVVDYFDPLYEPEISRVDTLTDYYYLKDVCYRITKKANKKYYCHTYDPFPIYNNIKTAYGIDLNSLYKDYKEQYVSTRANLTDIKDVEEQRKIVNEKKKDIVLLEEYMKAHPEISPVFYNITTRYYEIKENILNRAEGYIKKYGNNWEFN